MVIEMWGQDMVARNGREYRRFGWFWVVHTALMFYDLEYIVDYRLLSWFGDNR